VAALGNAAHSEDVPDIIAVAGDADVRVRSQAATALRSVDSPQARAGLLALATDRSSAVASSALASLGKQTLDDGDWRALRDLARDSRQPPGADAALVDLVRQKAGARAEGREILGKLLERNRSPDSDLPGIIRGLLKEDRGG
jgi:HEAT repeat protein